VLESIKAPRFIDFLSEPGTRDGEANLVWRLSMGENPSPHNAPQPGGGFEDDNDGFRKAPGPAVPFSPIPSSPVSVLVTVLTLDACPIQSAWMSSKCSLSWAAITLLMRVPRGTISRVRIPRQRCATQDACSCMVLPCVMCRVFVRVRVRVRVCVALRQQKT